MPILPKPGQGHQPLIGKRDGIGLLPRRGLLPLVKVIDRHQAAPLLEGLAKSRPVLYPLGLGIDVSEADLKVFGPKRHQAPPQYVEAAFSGLGIVPDDWQRVSWPERRVEAYYLQRTRLESIAERKLRRRQLTDDGNVEITGRDLREKPFAVSRRLH